MVKRLLFVCILFISLFQKGYGQGVFSTPANYGFLCDEARYLCGSELDGYNGTLLQALSPLPQPSPICAGNGSPENTQWISFIADDSILHLNITFDNFSYTSAQGPGISIGLYQDCILNVDNADDFELDCNTEQGSSGSIDIQPDSTLIIPGNIYYLYFDGYAGAACDFTIDVISGVCVEDPQADEECVQDCGVSNNLNDYHGCTQQEETYSFQPNSIILDNLSSCNPFELNAELDSIIHIDWEISPPTGYTIQTTASYFDSLDITSYLTVEWEAPGTYTIKPIMSINPLFATCRSMCECTDDVAYTVVIEELVIDTLSVIELCPTSTQPYPFCGQFYNSNIDVTCYDRDLCTTTVQEIRVKDRVDLPIDTIFICPNDCFEFNNIEYCSPSLYNIPFNECDSFLQILLIDLELDLSFSLVENLIDCNNTQARMTADVDHNPLYTGEIKTFWLNEAGDTVSFAESYITSEAGTYTFFAVPVDSPDCFETLSNNVTKDDQLPNVTFDPPMLDCNNMSDDITINTSDVVTSIAWSGPNGFASSDMSPTVMEGGFYIATIIVANGCSIVDSTEVFADFVEPNLEVMHDDFDCSENIPVAQYMSASNIVSVEWTTPSGVSNDQILNLTSDGNYNLTVTASNGCTATEAFVVVDNSYDPTLGLMEDFIWRCNDTVRTIDISSQLDPNLNYQWTTIGGILASNDEILNISSPDIFVLTGTDDSLGCVGKDTVTVMEDPNLFSDIDFTINNPLCFAGTDGSIEINSFVGGEGPFTYSYGGIDFDNLQDMMFPTGMQTLSIFDVYGCEVIKTFEIVSSETFEIITEPVVSVKYGQMGILSASVNIADSLLNNIIWADTEGNFLAEGHEVEIDAIHQTVVVIAEDINGCIAETNVTLEIDYDIEIFYPNVFSPNQDGVNDYFELYSDGKPQSLDLLQIYDRAGELIHYETDQGFNETQSGWDGKFNGQFVEPGVYVFLIKYTLGNGEKRSKSGSITVLR